MRKQPRILYFVKGVMPSIEAQEVAGSYGAANVAFRNANFVPEDGALEQCDGVAGEVPERYKEKYPSAEEAIETFEAERKKEIADKKKANAAAKKAETEAKKKVEAEAKKKAEEEAKKNGGQGWKPNA